MTDTLRGSLWMIGTIVSFSLMGVAGRELAGVLDTFEIMLYRSVVGVLIVLSVITARGLWHEVNTRNLPTHLLRNLTHFTGQNLWFFAVTVIPLAQVFALEFTNPLWVLLLSPLLLGERLTRMKLFCAALGFIGVLIVTRPGTSEINAGVFTAALAAVFFAISIILTKRLTRTASIACILFYLTTMQLVMGLIAAGYDGDIAIPSGVAVLWVIAVGLAGLLAHFCYTKALSLAPATVVVPIDFARLPTIAIIAWLVYSEAIDPWVFIGAAVIFAGNYLNILSEQRAQKH